MKKTVNHIVAGVLTAAAVLLTGQLASHPVQAAAFTTKVEAESFAAKTGDVYIRENGAQIPTDQKGGTLVLTGASGNKYVDFSNPVDDISTYQNTIPEGHDSATWNVTVPHAGYYQLQFKYNNPATKTTGHRNDRDERNFQISINNSTDPLSDQGWAGWMIFNISGYKDPNTPQTTVQNTDKYAPVIGNTAWNDNYMNVYLKAGENTVTLTLQAPPGQAVFDGPNLDYFDVTDVTDQYVSESQIPYVSKNFQFKHPGIFYTTATLDRIRAHKNLADTVDGKAYAQLKASPLSSVDYQDSPQAEINVGPYNNPNTGGTQLTKDSFAASSNALLWYMDRNPANAKKAIQILNDWSSTLKTVGHGNDAKLRFALTFPDMLNAAELMKNVYNKQANVAAADKWQQADMDRFAAFVKSMMIARGGDYSPTADFYPQANGNWDANIGVLNMAAAVYLNDADLYNAALKQFYIGTAQSSTQLSMGALPNYVYPTGEIQEPSRDQTHAKMGISGLAMQSAISAIQGVDTFSAYNNRLLTGTMYYARYNLGQDVPSDTFISDKSRGKDDALEVFEIVGNHYAQQRGESNADVQLLRQAANQLSRTDTVTDEAGQKVGWLRAALCDISTLPTPPVTHPSPDFTFDDGFVKDATITQGQSFDQNAGIHAWQDSNHQTAISAGDWQVDGKVDTSKTGTYTLTYTITNAFGKTVTLTRTIKVVADDSVKFTDINDVVYVQTTKAEQYSLDAKTGKFTVTGQLKGLTVASAWKTARKAVTLDGKVYYQVGGNGWLRAEDVTFSRLAKSNGIVDVTNANGAKTTIKPVSTTQAVQTLAINTGWKYSAVATNADGTRAYLVADRQWIQALDVVERVSNKANVVIGKTNAPVFTGHGDVFKGRTLKAGSAWKVTGIKYINGKVYYRVATDLYVRADYGTFNN
ncbi:MAG: DUF5011 domain-containing protein [Schleiferilactobacillus harbinensis]|jgi:hypothetical protein|nr:DUF5011 domain-containing protein [Schleiferilactobacillus harbinensis]MCI1911993.1 DUF5011 domain-containing protein [Schleiferilactobacillus harbinensis]